MINAPLDFETLSNYDDAMLFDLAKVFAAHFRFTMDNTLDYFGQWYIAYIYRAWNMEKVARSPNDFFGAWNDFMMFKRVDFPQMMLINFKVFPEDKHGYRVICTTSSTKITRFIIGIITQVATKIFIQENIKFKIMLGDIIEKKFKNETVYLHYISVMGDNSSYAGNIDITAFEESNLDELRDVYFPKLFPFYIYFDNDLTILRCGHSIKAILPEIMGAQLNEVLKIQRPEEGWINMEWFMYNTDRVCELYCTKGESMLTLSGQVVVFEEEQTAIYLCSPKQESFDNPDFDIFLADYANCDNTRGMLLSAMLKHRRLVLAYDEEVAKNRIREENMFKKENENAMAEDFLNSSMPPSIIERIRSGTIPFVDTCEVKHNVAVIFNDLCGFTQTSSRLEPNQVVELLSTLWQKYDNLVTDMGNVYKIETIGDAYVVAAGVPDPDANSAQNAVNMAVAMNLAIWSVKLEFMDKPLSCRIGIAIGDVVAGVIGCRTPRYSIYGDTVVTAQLFESKSDSKCILVSQGIHDALQNNREFSLKKAEEINGLDQTAYWVTRAYNVYLEKIRSVKIASANLKALVDRKGVKSKHSRITAGSSKDSKQYSDYSSQRLSQESKFSNTSKVSKAWSEAEDEDVAEIAPTEGGEAAGKEKETKDRLEVESEVEAASEIAASMIVQTATPPPPPKKPSLISRMSSSDLVRGLVSRLSLNKKSLSDINPVEVVVMKSE